MGCQILAFPRVSKVAAGIQANIERGEIGGNDEPSIAGATVVLEILLFQVAVGVATPRMGMIATVMSIGSDGEGVGIIGRGYVAVDTKTSHIAGIVIGARVAVAGTTISAVVVGSGVGVNLDVLVSIIFFAGIEGDRHSQLGAGSQKVILWCGSVVVVIDGHIMMSLGISSIRDVYGATIDGDVLHSEGICSVDWGACSVIEVVGGQ